MPPIHDALFVIPLGADLVQIVGRVVHAVRPVLNRETVLKVQREVAPEVKHPFLGGGRVAFELDAIFPFEETLRVSIMIHDERLPDGLGKIETLMGAVGELHARHFGHPTGRETTTRARRHGTRTPKENSLKINPLNTLCSSSSSSSSSDTSRRQRFTRAESRIRRRHFFFLFLLCLFGFFSDCDGRDRCVYTARPPSSPVNHPLQAARVQSKVPLHARPPRFLPAVRVHGHADVRGGVVAVVDVVVRE